MKDIRSSSLALLKDGTFRVTLADCAILRPCSMSQFRRTLREGGTPVFALSQESNRLKPAWYLLVQDTQDEIWRVTTTSHPVARRLISVQQIYQVARDAGLNRVSIPIEQALSTVCDTGHAPDLPPVRVPSTAASQHVRT